MAAELSFRHTATGSTMKATIRQPLTTGGKIRMWQTAGTPGWEDLTVANWANYILTMTETPADSYGYVGDWPATLTTVGWYAVDFYDGATIAGTLAGTFLGYWDGTNFVLGGADARQVAGTATAVPGAAGGMLISGSNAGTTTLGALTVTGTTTLTGAVSLGSTLGVTGAVTFSSTFATGAVTLASAAITGALSVGTTTTLTGAVSLGSTLAVVGTTTFTGAVAMSAGLAAAITGNITGNLSGSVGSVTTKTGYSLVSTGLDLVTAWTTAITGNITGNLSGSVGSVTGAVGSVTGAVGSVTGAVGSVTGSVGSVTGAVGSVTGSVGSIATGGIVAATFATDAIAAGAVSAAAVTKIQSGLSTHSAANVKTAIEAAGSHLALILADTGTDIPATIVTAQATLTKLDGMLEEV
ncbi:MAG TPA: hypothetical protein VMY35_06575 [Phycisphaerae bacterium]|nr:hypothetical protein [Phycisphaerae bacterium]